MSEKVNFKQLSELNRKTDVILNSTHDGLISIGKDYKVELFNRAAEKILGIKKDRVLGKDVREVIPNTRLHIVLNKGEAELNKIQHAGDITIITNRVPVYDEQGNIIGAVAVFRDITEVKKTGRRNYQFERDEDPTGSYNKCYSGCYFSS